MAANGVECGIGVDSSRFVPRIERVVLNPDDFKEMSSYLAGCEVIRREFTLREKLYNGLARLLRLNGCERVNKGGDTDYA